jgi:hypothetical protein
VDQIVLAEKTSWPVQGTLHHAGMGAPGFMYGRDPSCFNMPSEEGMALLEKHVEVEYSLDRDTVNV